MCDLISWDVITPSGQAGFSAQKPRGSVCIKESHAGTEYVSVPASVARTLERARRKGAEAHSRAEVLDLIDKTTRSVARERVVRLLERRDYATKEVRERLEREGFDKHVAREVCERAVRIGLINDKRFAEFFVRAKVASGWGMERIVRELGMRGIDAHELEGWPYEYLDPDEELVRAIDIASRKRVKEPNAYAKLVRFLVGRGFAYGVATSAARRVLAE